MTHAKMQPFYVLVNNETGNPVDISAREAFARIFHKEHLEKGTHRIIRIPGEDTEVPPATDAQSALVAELRRVSDDWNQWDQTEKFKLLHFAVKIRDILSKYEAK